MRRKKRNNFCLEFKKKEFEVKDLVDYSPSQNMRKIRVEYVKEWDVLVTLTVPESETRNNAFDPEYQGFCGNFENLILTARVYKKDNLTTVLAESEDMELNELYGSINFNKNMAC